jgi:mono/diheme cytochrome c family protein
MLSKMRTTALAMTILSAALCFGVAVGDGAWLNGVPAREREKTNPFRAQPDEISAGRRVYMDHCSHCHGENAEGTKKRPALTTDRILHQATEGDLHWLLVNGSMKKGMPTWSKLGDPQIWQVISYLKSLHP